MNTIINRYNQSTSIPTGILEKMHKMSSYILIENGMLLHKEFDMKTILLDLVNEITERTKSDIMNIQTHRYFNIILNVLGHSAPKLIVPHLPMLGDELLNLDVS